MIHKPKHTDPLVLLFPATIPRAPAVINYRTEMPGLDRRCQIFRIEGSRRVCAFPTTNATACKNRLCARVVLHFRCKNALKRM